MLILFMQPSALDPGPIPTQSSPPDQRSRRLQQDPGSRADSRHCGPKSLSSPGPQGFLASAPRVPGPLFPPVDTPRLEVAQRALVEPQHLLLVRQIGRRSAERHSARLTFSGRRGGCRVPGRGRSRGGAGAGAGAGRLSVLPGHFRFCRGGACRAVMSRFKFVGKGGFSLALGLAGGLGSPLRGVAFRGCRGFRDASRAGNE